MKASGIKLCEMIKKAISDCELTMSEYDQIVSLAAEDGIIDAEERSLLAQLEDLIANKVVIRVAG